MSITNGQQEMWTWAPEGNAGTALVSVLEDWQKQCVEMPLGLNWTQSPHGLCIVRQEQKVPQFKHSARQN
jgi:hypothetical protein